MSEHAVPARQSRERQVISRFEQLAHAQGLTTYSTQSRENRLLIRGAVYYQFGDLRVELPTHTVIVEVESSGGVSNLAKYWECFAVGRLQKPLRLLHLFHQKSSADYESHHIVWRFLCSRMHAEFADRFEGRLMTYKAHDHPTLEAALKVFQEWIVEGLPGSHRISRD